MNYYEALKVGIIIVYDNDGDNYCSFTMDNSGKIIQRINGVGVMHTDYTEVNFNAIMEELFNDNFYIKIIICKNIRKYMRRIKQ